MGLRVSLGIVLLCLTSSIFADIDKTVCKIPDEAKDANGVKIKPPTRPAVGGVFETHIVLNIVSRNFTTELHQYYSFQDDHSVIQQIEKSQRWQGYADYSTNQLLGVLPDSHQCNVTKLSEDENRFLFGYKKSFTKAHVPTADAVLHLLQSDEDTIERYVGKQTIRGIPCNVWYTCTYWPEMESTMNIYWYFSDPDKWTAAAGQVSVPVRAWVKGRRYDTPSFSRDFEHKYEFLHWKNKITRQYYWETPRGVSCPGRVNTKPLPPITTRFSFTLEQVDKDLGLVTFVKEFYDYDRQLFRFDYRARGMKEMLYGDNTLSEVHDYATGVAYITDTFRGNCSVQPIQENTLDAATTDQTHVVMRSAVAFLYLDNEKPTYEGIKQVRGVDCDTWVATRYNFPPGTNLNTTWEWSFVANTWSTEQAQASQDKSAGNLMQLALTQGAHTTTYYNIYNFQKVPPLLTDYDISACYINRNRRVFQVDFPAGAGQTIAQNMKSFKEGVVNSVSKLTGLSPLRVANVQVNFNYAVSLTFELLDVAPVPGDLSYVKPQIALKDAANVLYDAVRTNAFKVQLDDRSGNVQAATFFALPNTLQEKEYQLTQPDNGYGTGVTAAVAAVMAVVGVAVGGGGAYAVSKKCLQK